MNLEQELCDALRELVCCPIFTGQLFAKDEASHRAWTLARAAIEKYHTETKDEGLHNEIELLHAMRDYGGHFASYLAVAWLRADTGNRRILRHNFNNLLETYHQFLLPKEPK